MRAVRRWYQYEARWKSGGGEFEKRFSYLRDAYDFLYRPAVDNKTDRAIFRVNTTEQFIRINGNGHPTTTQADSGAE